MQKPSNEALVGTALLVALVGFLYLGLVRPVVQYADKCRAAGGMVWSNNHGKACLLPPLNRMEID